MRMVLRIVLNTFGLYDLWSLQEIFEIVPSDMYLKTFFYNLQNSYIYESWNHNRKSLWLILQPLVIVFHYQGVCKLNLN